MRARGLLVALGVALCPFAAARGQAAPAGTVEAPKPPLPEGGDPTGREAAPALPGDNDVFSLAEEYLKRELEQRLGPARRYEVHLNRERSDLSNGRLGGVDVIAAGVRTHNGLLISRIELHLGEVQLDEKMHPVRSTVTGTFFARLGRQAISRFVEERAGKKVHGIRLDFRPGELVVHAKPEVLGLGIPSEVTGRPTVRDGRQIDFEAHRVSVLGVRLPAAAREALEKRLNPVVDLSGLKMPIRVTRVDVLPEGLEVRGDAELDPAHLPQRGTASRGRRRAPRENN